MNPEGAPEARESIASAAVLFDGKPYTGPNHAYIMTKLSLEHPDWKNHSTESGFVTSVGRFVNREEAGEIAHQSEQLSHLDRDDRERAAGNLHSQDIIH